MSATLTAAVGVEAHTATHSAVEIIAEQARQRNVKGWLYLVSNPFLYTIRPKLPLYPIRNAKNKARSLALADWSDVWTRDGER